MTTNEAKSVAEAMDDLEKAAHRVTELLKDRHPGLTSWNDMLWDACVGLDNAVHSLGVPQLEGKPEQYIGVHIEEKAVQNG